MVAVSASETQVLAAIEPYAQEMAMAAINGPRSTVISGRQEALGKIVAALQSQGIKTKLLEVSQAFHSPLIEPMLADFQRVVASMAFSAPRVNIISNLTGENITDEMAQPEYWVNRAFDEFVINLGFDQSCDGVSRSGKLMSRLQDGRVQSYMRIIGIGLVALVLFLIWGGAK